MHCMNNGIGGYREDTKQTRSYAHTAHTHAATCTSTQQRTRSNAHAHITLQTFTHAYLVGCRSQAPRGGGAGGGGWGVHPPTPAPPIGRCHHRLLQLQLWQTLLQLSTHIRTQPATPKPHATTRPPPPRTTGVAAAALVQRAGRAVTTRTSPLLVEEQSSPTGPASLPSWTALLAQQSRSCGMNGERGGRDEHKVQGNQPSLITYPTYQDGAAQAPQPALAPDADLMGRIVGGRARKQRVIAKQRHNACGDIFEHVCVEIGPVKHVAQHSKMISAKQSAEIPYRCPVRARDGRSCEMCGRCASLACHGVSCWSGGRDAMRGLEASV